MRNENSKINRSKAGKKCPFIVASIYKKQSTSCCVLIETDSFWFSSLSRRLWILCGGRRSVILSSDRK